MEEKETMSVTSSTANISTHIIQHLKEEIVGCLGYLKMAEKIENSDPRLARYIAEMAYDEYTHAKFIYEYLKDEHYEMPKELAEAYWNMKQKVADCLFR